MVRTSPANQWLALERLPRSVRDALNDAIYPWAPYPLWRRWNAGVASAKDLVTVIELGDRAATERLAMRAKPKRASHSRPSPRPRSE